MLKSNHKSHGSTDSSFFKFLNVIFLIFVGLYLILPVFAPVLMNLGLEKPGKIIYWIYSHFCHQLAYRSWFMFGQQSNYPLAESNPNHFLSYEEVFGMHQAEWDVAQGVIGNSFTGYKIALCQRDLAIYFSLFIFGFMFMLSGKNIKKIPFYIWFIFGVLPIAIDGISQLVRFLPIKGLEILYRESTPLIRTITGACFGWFTGWVIFPSIHEMISNHDGNNKKIANTR